MLVGFMMAKRVGAIYFCVGPVSHGLLLMPGAFEDSRFESWQAEGQDESYQRNLHCSSEGKEWPQVL